MPGSQLDLKSNYPPLRAVPSQSRCFLGEQVARLVSADVRSTNPDCAAVLPNGLLTNNQK